MPLSRYAIIVSIVINYMFTVHYDLFNFISRIEKHNIDPI